MKTSHLKLLVATSLTTIACALNLHAANLTWDADAITVTGAQDGAGSWSTLAANTNWWDGAANVTWNNATPDNATFGAGSGAAGIVTIPSSTTNTVGNLTFNAAGSGFYVISNGNSASRLTLSGTPNITVAGGVSATNIVALLGTSFTKLGAGTFVLKPVAANTNAGPTVVGAGTLVIGTTTGRLVIPGNLTITNGATVLMAASEQIADTGIVTVDGGTYDSGGKSETIGGFILNNNAQVLSASSTQAITNNGATYDLRSGFVFPNLAGTAGLTKTTAGTVVITNGGGANTFSGPVLVSAGILDLGHSTSGGSYALPGTTITVTNTGMIRLGKDNQININATVVVAGGTYELLGHNDTNTTLILDNGGQILNGGNTAKTLGVLASMDFRNGLCASKLGGIGMMTKSTTGTVTLTMDNANTSGTLISAGILQLGDGSSTNRGQFGTGPVTNNSVIVLNHSGAFTLANLISGSGSLTNLGGSPSLTGASTYAGGTTVNGGTLFVNNTSGSGTGTGAVNVQFGAGLGGTGIIGGVANILSGGNLAPGNAGQGTLTVSNTLTLAGNTTIKFISSTNGLLVDQVIANTANYGGTLTVTTNYAQTNAPAFAFAAGNTFQIFSAGASAANFAGIVGSPGANLNWSFNPTNGILSVVTVGAVTPPVLSVAQSGSTLTFSWTDASFKLQSQTNSLATGLKTNWFDYPGGGSSPVGVTFNPANPTVFFRLSQ